MWVTIRISIPKFLKFFFFFLITKSIKKSTKTNLKHNFGYCRSGAVWCTLKCGRTVPGTIVFEVVLKLNEYGWVGLVILACNGISVGEIEILNDFQVIGMMQVFVGMQTGYILWTWLVEGRPRATISALFMFTFRGILGYSTQLPLPQVLGSLIFSDDESSFSILVYRKPLLIPWIRIQRHCFFSSLSNSLWVGGVCPNFATFGFSRRLISKRLDGSGWNNLSPLTPSLSLFPFFFYSNPSRSKPH